MRRLAFTLVLSLSVYVPLAVSAMDERIVYTDGAVAKLNSKTRHVTEVLILPGDHIESIQGGDSSSWFVSVSKQHDDRFFIKPKKENADSNFLIEGENHDYWLHVMASNRDDDIPYRLRWVYSKKTRKQHLNKKKVVVPSFSTKILYASGDHLLMPDWYFTDNVATYFHWPYSSDIPAIYASKSKGEHYHLVNLRVRHGVIVVMEKSPYWRFVLEGKRCVLLSTDKRDVLRESSFWHTSHCYKDIAA